MTAYKHASLRCALTLVGLSLIACSSSTQPNSSAGYVSGSVATIHGDLLSGVTVRLKPWNGPAPTPATTDKRGFYAMFHVPAGPGTIAISGGPTGCTQPADTVYYVPPNSPASVGITVLCP